MFVAILPQVSHYILNFFLFGAYRRNEYDLFYFPDRSYLEETLNGIVDIDQTLYIYQMPKTLTIKDKSSLRLYSTGMAGAVASFLTQPLEVIKTNRIDTPAILYYELHQKIISKGWRAYMRGGSIAVTRQAFGFTFYTHMLTRLQSKISKNFPSLNKFMNYSISSVTAKLIAMTFEAPLTLLKTRIQCVASSSVMEQFKTMMISPKKQFTKGLGSSVAREGSYTLFHYNTYRYLKDQIFFKRYNSQATFIPAFFSGVVAITVSQPFEVIRSQISLRKFNESVLLFIGKQWGQFGVKGFFIGFLPRLLRKPINSGICWSILEWSRNLE